MTWLAVALAVVVAGVAALLRAGGAALVRVARADALHDAADGRRGARTIARLLERPDVLAPSIGAIHTLLLIAAAIPFTWVLATTAEGVRLALALVMLGVVLVVATDLLPRSIGRAAGRRVAYPLAALVSSAVTVGERLTDIVRDDDDQGGGVTEEGDDQEEKELISSVLEFGETIVREVMVPRTDMITVSRDTAVSYLVSLVDQHGFSRFPVEGEGIDDIVGMVIVKDLLPALVGGNRPDAVADVLRPVDFVPETKPVSDLLREMQADRSHLAIVVDEYGGTAGLVTIEDLLEELVGEIVDEYDESELLVEEHDDGVWLVDARLPVADLSDVLGVELPDEEWDTVGGLVLGLAGRVPRESEEFDVDGVTVTVTRVQGRRVAEVLVRHPNGLAS